MKIIVSSQFIYSWVEFKNGIITNAGDAWSSWRGRSLVALLGLVEDKKHPVKVRVDSREMTVAQFYQQFAEEFTLKEEVNGRQ